MALAPQPFSARRLPKPSTRTRLRKEVVLRPASPEDAAPCALLDTSYSTTHVWQLDTRHDSDELRVTFRQVRLPRELTLIADHRPPSGAGSRRGQLWLVAEEVEVRGGAPRGGEDVAAAPGPRDQNGQTAHIPAGRPEAPPPAASGWSHALRRTGRASTVQLSLPPCPPPALAPAPRPTAGKIAGYVAVAAAPQGDTAYLRALAVDRTYRRHGIATRLLAEARRWAMQQGASLLMADVPARNYPAIRLLQKAGFTFCGYNDCGYPQTEVAVFFSTRLR